jgi:hypothetical protein
MHAIYIIVKIGPKLEIRPYRELLDPRSCD